MWAHNLLEQQYTLQMCGPMIWEQVLSGICLFRAEDVEDGLAFRLKHPGVLCLLTESHRKQNPNALRAVSLTF